ncbi:MAG: glycosyltransferase family 4 protein [Mycobacteriales bacterium]
MIGSRASSDRSGKLAFVPTRYAKGMVGGAELVLAQMAHGLAERGWDVEILTTCASNHWTWENELPAGDSIVDGVPVQRFPVVKEDIPERGVLEHEIMAGGVPSITEQQRWMNSGMRVPALYHHLVDHGDDYRAVLFTPYPSWVTFACAQAVPDKSVLWTCLHDEPYAYLELFQPVFTGVAGLLFQSGPEHQLAHRIADPLSPHAVVGCPVAVPKKYDPDGFRERYGIDGRFVFYTGRREGGKGWPDLLDMLARAVARSPELPFSLVTGGAGEIDAPAPIKDRVIDVGFLPDEERDNAMAAADAYMQPGRYEAFSMTIMESWLAGTPVIANGAGEVVAWHCKRSGAGLTYDDEFEFEQCLRFLAEAPEAAAELAAPGRDYVLDNYQTEHVLDRVECEIARWTGIRKGSVAGS